MLKAITFKVEAKQLKLLDGASQATHISKSALIRKGIMLVIQQIQEDVISPAFRRQVDQLMRDDKGLLKRLSEA